MLDALDYLIGLVQDGVAFDYAVRLTCQGCSVSDETELRQMYSDVAPVYGLEAA